ncbi:Chitin synthase 5 [Zancudomyces culisetae]|uniref:chitin synthase n=1 Tax=Zancudomyces culisetae TaxID=1213189 RepID=A0A1R1PM28_ZANCU|nr:Chitin synthase 5 [Zancudomyces culisetae]|eukprot:OMH82014.1 Chitin synthase 5 [Zancudomyces culisetae]
MGNKYVVVNGRAYDASRFVHPPSQMTGDEAVNILGDPVYASMKDLSLMFQNPNTVCKSVLRYADDFADDAGNVVSVFPCVPVETGSTDAPKSDYPSGVGCHNTNTARNALNSLKYSEISYVWDEVQTKSNNYVIYNGYVLDMKRIKWVLDGVIVPPLFEKLSDGQYAGKDISYTLSRMDSKYGKCLKEMFTIGYVDTSPVGCLVSTVILYASLLVILGAVFSKFAMAVYFNWFMSRRLGRAKLETARQRKQRIEEIERWANINTHYGTEKIVPKYTVTDDAGVGGGVGMRKKGRFLPTTSRYSRLLPGEEPGGRDRGVRSSNLHRMSRIHPEFGSPLSVYLNQRQTGSFGQHPGSRPGSSSGYSSPYLGDQGAGSYHSSSPQQPQSSFFSGSDSGRRTGSEYNLSNVGSPQLEYTAQYQHQPGMSSPLPQPHYPSESGRPSTPSAGTSSPLHSPMINGSRHKKSSTTNLPKDASQNLDLQQESLVYERQLQMQQQQQQLLQQPMEYFDQYIDPFWVFMLVTCYSEGSHGIRTTLDSLAATEYSSRHKCLFVICDGLIKGAGEELSTPDVCLSMMQDFVIPPDHVQPFSYVSIAMGAKRHNMAKLYAGYYLPNENSPESLRHERIPMVLVVKCGTPEEANDKKPGNRGKRDSQVILMSFLQRTTFDERMTRLEYEMFNAIWSITGVTPDNFEAVLMVDADTKVYPDSLARLVGVLVEDPLVMGLCGETQIANKGESFTTMIQVFEYYIAHHLAKAFESVFGGVTCLPGCFCMYRIKSPKGYHGYWVPILANPDIVEHYSDNVVDTLHKKNLLLLGEDRYLTTLMLKTFPKRKMVFVPAAVCKTIVPNSFGVLMSQRRRWINSTVHNLMELVMVNDLCGTFCFSMQFIVFMELIGTLVLPVAIMFTLYLCIISTFTRPVPWLPLMLLAIILGLPAILIGLTSRKIEYVGWMLIYLLALVIWNFVLPAYAYWHFDDFSWGETRKVQGETKEKTNDHGTSAGEFDSSSIVMKRWCDFEAEKRFKLKTILSTNPDFVTLIRSTFEAVHSTNANTPTSTPPITAPIVNLTTNIVKDAILSKQQQKASSGQPVNVNSDSYVLSMLMLDIIDHVDSLGYFTPENLLYFYSAIPTSLLLPPSAVTNVLTTSSSGTIGTGITGTTGTTGVTGSTGLTGTNSTTSFRSSVPGSASMMGSQHFSNNSRSVILSPDPSQNTSGVASRPKSRSKTKSKRTSRTSRTIDTDSTKSSNTGSNSNNGTGSNSGSSNNGSSPATPTIPSLKNYTRASRFLDE